MRRAFIEGLRTGLILQIAVGPIFFYLVNIALRQSLSVSLLSAAAVMAADYVYIALAILGVGRLLQKDRAKRAMGAFSALVLVLFGIGILRSALSMQVIEAAGDSLQSSAARTVLTTFLLTLSSPMTIVFWTGIFTSRTLELELEQGELRFFGAAAGLSTFLFMGTAVLVLTTFKAVVPLMAVRWANALVGLLLVGYGMIRLIKTLRRDKMRVLVLGSGGREHAIVWSLAKSPSVDRIYAVPGNPGMADLAQCEALALNDQEAIVAFALESKIDLTVVGPEQPLVEGIADRLREAGIRVFGPGSDGARLEGSKIFSKEFMVRHGILTSDFAVYEDKASAIEGLDAFGYPLVIKVDGLAAGKGVLIPKNKEEAIRDLGYIFDDRKFGDAGEQVLIESFITGFEASILCLVDADHIIPLESARDYKKAYDGDKGLNTGGMGTISPNDKLEDDMMAQVKEDVLKKTLEGLKRDGIAFNGVIFIGLMITDAGEPYVLEYNVRFGDPETQSVLPRLKSDLGEVFVKTTDNRLGELELEWDTRTAVTVIMASGGYPEAYEKGLPIRFGQNESEVMVFHAGTRESGGEIVTNGGRVLGVTALADDKHQAREVIYKNVDRIDFEGKMYRTDIGL